jgi:hypothetical protein
LVAGASDWITNRIAWESPQLGSRVHWDTLTAQLSQGETISEPGIPVYALSVISNRARTGDWAIMTSIAYHLEMIGDNRFELIYARDVQSIPPEAGDHFWVASFQLEDQDLNRRLDFFRENNFRVGPAIAQRYGQNQIILVPVWRQ